MGVVVTPAAGPSTPSASSYLRLSINASSLESCSACLAMSVPNTARTSNDRTDANVSCVMKLFSSRRKRLKVTAKCMCSSGDESL